MAPPDVRALIFDVFGTVVDWRGSIIEQCAAFGHARGIERDWESSPTPGGASTSPT